LPASYGLSGLYRLTSDTDNSSHRTGSELRFLRWWFWRSPCSGTWRRIIWQKFTTVSEKSAVSMFRVAILKTRRHILQDDIICAGVVALNGQLWNMSTF